MFEHAPDAPMWRRKIEAFVSSATIQHFIVFLIVLNAILLGLETDPEIVQSIGTELAFIDHAILFVFTLEILLLMASRGLKYFLDPWCIFDFLVVGISLVPATESLSVLRSLRVLRVLRLINKVESMKRVVGGLLSSLPGLGSVFGLILIIFYVAGVIATNEFGKAFPDYFGSLSNTFFTLFQVMTLESWSDGVARPVMEKFPYAWIFFVLFILLITCISCAASVTWRGLQITQRFLIERRGSRNHRRRFYGTHCQCGLVGRVLFQFVIAGAQAIGLYRKTAGPERIADR